MSRRFHVALVVCIILLIAGLTAFAGAPNRTHLHVQVEGGDFWVCDTNNTGVVDDGDTHLEGQFWVNVNEFTDYDDAGNPLRITWTQSWHGVVTNLNTGETIFRDRFEGRDSFDFTTEVYSQSGATRHLFRPGEGSLYHDAGRISVNLITGEVLEESGRHSFLTTEPWSFCQLAGAGDEISWTPQPSELTILGPR